jgi:hypothetical protein
LTRDDNGLTSNFSLDFKNSSGTQDIISSILPAVHGSEIYRQQIQILNGTAKSISVRVPHWATSVSAVDKEGKALEATLKNGLCTVAERLSEATFIFEGGVYAEDRHCARLPEGPEPGEPYTLWYGPKLLVREESTSPLGTWPVSIDHLMKKGFAPLTPETRSKEVYFIISNLTD